MLNSFVHIDAALFLHELERTVKQIHDLYNALELPVLPDHELAEVDGSFQRRVQTALQSVPHGRVEDWAAMSTWLRCSVVAINHCQREVAKMKGRDGRNLK